jgi:exodeoxyribonuclease V alpha subunit
MSALADRHDARRALGAPGLLRVFNDAGVLATADVHVATRLAALAHEEDEAVVLAVALAVRAPRLGHVHVDLATVRRTAAVDVEEEVDLDALPWPEPGDWAARVAASALLGPDRPLHLEGTWLYLDRYRAEERQVADDLLALAGSEPGDADVPSLADALHRLYPDDPDGLQARATAAAARRRLAVVAGGPGTGKTTTVGRIVALVAERAAAAGDPTPLVALAAPTGKAAARLEEAVHAEAAGLDVAPATRELLGGLRATTLHRLLGRRPDSHSRFRHDRRRRLPHDLVVVDETSMVSLSLMARLAEAVRPDARLVLVGDPGQLASVEAGAVLGDVVGPAAEDGEATGPLADGIVVLQRVHRYGVGIGAVADAIRRGDADELIGLLEGEAPEVEWIAADPAEDEGALEPVRAGAVAAAEAVLAPARSGDADGALRALGAYRLLCAHRRGPHGVGAWAAGLESWLAAADEDFDPMERWYAGRPLLVTENDDELRLYNGDTGVVVQHEDRLVAAFERGGTVVTHGTTRLGAVDTAYAMTIHKSQGSQWGTVAVLLPPPGSRILTRELLYTAVTRARERLVLVGTEEAIRAAVRRPVARASGLRRRLWG